MKHTTLGTKRTGIAATRRAAGAFAWDGEPVNAVPMAINAMHAVVSPNLHRFTGTIPRPPELRC